MIARALLAATVAGFLVGCQHPDILVEGPGQTFDAKEIAEYAKNQDEVELQIRQLAGLTKEPVTSDDWRRFVAAGIQYADQRCESYMQALFWFDRAKERTEEEINLVRTALIGVLGLLEATTKSITVTDTIFGLSDSTVKNIGKGLLYDLDPSAVRALVEKLQQNYEKALPPEGYKDRPAAFRAIHDYAAICLPPFIETQVAQAIAESKPNAKPGDPELGTPPIVQIAPLPEVHYSSNEDTKLLRAFWKPDGTNPDKANTAKIKQAMNKHGAAGLTISELLYAKEYQEVRSLVVQTLKLK